MKATDQYFPVVLFIMLYKVTFESVDEIIVWPFKWKQLSTLQYFSVVMFIVLYKTVLTVDSMNKILNKSRWGAPLLWYECVKKYNCLKVLSVLRNCQISGSKGLKTKWQNTYGIRWLQQSQNRISAAWSSQLLKRPVFSRLNKRASALSSEPNDSKNFHRRTTKPSW